MSITIRHDDFDFRMTPDEYIKNHQKFIDAGLTETAVVQLTQHGNIFNINKHREIVDYLNNAPNWDIQLHGWTHDDYSIKEYKEIIKELAASIYFFQEFFGKKPTIWFPPWNGTSKDMVEAASLFGMEIDNESCDIGKGIRELESGNFTGHSIYYHLWNRNESEMVDKMIELVKKYENR